MSGDALLSRNRSDSDEDGIPNEGCQPDNNFILGNSLVSDDDDNSGDDGTSNDGYVSDDQATPEDALAPDGGFGSRDGFENLTQMSATRHLTFKINERGATSHFTDMSWYSQLFRFVEAEEHAQNSPWLS